jgi:hypothetical protein
MTFLPRYVSRSSYRIGDFTGCRSWCADQIASPPPAAISTTVTFPRVLWKNVLGDVGPAPPGSFVCVDTREAGVVVRMRRVAPDKCVSLEGAVAGAASLAAQGRAAAPSATVMLSTRAAVRLIDRLTCTS